MKKLILASTSRYRRQLLARLGVPFSAQGHGVDECVLRDAFFLTNPVSAERSSDLPHTLLDSAERGGALAQHLAEKKARAIAKTETDAWVLGSDQLAFFAGEVLGKPGSVPAAKQQLRKLSGHTHLLCTGTALVAPGGSMQSRLDVHRMTMRELTDSEIDRYVALESPIDCAGSYKIEQAGIALFERLEGEDFTAITGLPLMTVTRLLLQEGFQVPGPAPRAATPSDV